MADREDAAPDAHPDAPDADADVQRRAADAKRKRDRRAELRAEREKAYRDAADAERTPSNVPSNVHVLPSLPLKPPLGVLLDEHFRRVVVMIERLIADETVPLADRTRVCIAALSPMARSTETSELVAKVEELEQRFNRQGRA